MKLFFHKKMSLLLEGYDIEKTHPLFKTPLVVCSACTALDGVGSLYGLIAA